MKVIIVSVVRWGELVFPALVLGVLGALVTWEALQVTLASPEQVAEYHFGTESMIYHGGPFYRSQLIYVASGIAAGVAAFSLSGLLILVSRRTSPWFWSSLVPFGLAVAAAGATMLASWQHNPQGAIHDELGVGWLHWLSIGASWFVLVYAGSLLVVWLVVLGVSVVSRLRQSAA